MRVLDAVVAVSFRTGRRIRRPHPFDQLAGRNDLFSGNARVNVEAGAGVIAYPSVIDNVTNDPTTISARR